MLVPLGMRSAVLDEATALQWRSRRLSHILRAWKDRSVETCGNQADLCRSMQISQQNMENMENMESGGLSEGNLNLVGHCILELTGGCDQVETFTAQHLGCIDQNLLVR